MRVQKEGLSGKFWALDGIVEFVNGIAECSDAQAELLCGSLGASKIVEVAPQEKSEQIIENKLVESEVKVEEKPQIKRRRRNSKKVD